MIGKALDQLADTELRRLRPAQVVLLPIGSIEPHGHLPLGTDRMIAGAILQRVAADMGDVWLFPALPLGHNFKYGEWPGSIGLASETVTQIIESVASGLARMGLRRLFVMSGHDENRESVVTGLRNASHCVGTLSIYCDWLDLAWSLATEISSSRREGHASEIQTSVMQYLFPDRSFRGVPADDGGGSPPPLGADDMFAQGEAGLWIRPVGRDSECAFTGDPSQASLEKGRLIVERIVHRVEELIIALRQEPLPGATRHGQP